MIKSANEVMCQALWTVLGILCCAIYDLTCLIYWKKKSAKLLPPYTSCKLWLEHWCYLFFPLESCAADTDNCKACMSGEQKCETCDKGYKPDANGVCQGIIFLYTVVLPHPTITYITASKTIMLLISVLLGRSVSTKYVFLEFFMPCLK